MCKHFTLSSPLAVYCLCGFCLPLRNEYDALFDRFKAQLKEQKGKLTKDEDGSAAFYCTLWHRKIKGEREDLENKFHSSLKE